MYPIYSTLQPTTQAVYNFRDWQRPCKTVKADELSRGRNSSRFAQDLQAKKSEAVMSDAVLKLRSLWPNPCCTLQYKKAIKYSDLLTFNVTTRETDEQRGIFQHARLRSFETPPRLHSAPSLTFSTLVSLSSPSISRLFLILCSTLPPSASDPPSQSVLIQFLTAVCTSVSKSGSPRGLSSKGCQEDKEAAQPCANC